MVRGMHFNFKDSHVVSLAWNLGTHLPLPLPLLLCHWTLYPKQAGTALIGMQVGELVALLS